MRHHLETFRTYGIHNLGSFFGISNFELLLKEDGSLLVRRLDDTCYEEVVRRSRGGMEKRQEVDRLETHIPFSQGRIALYDDYLPHALDQNFDVEEEQTGFE